MKILFAFVTVLVLTGTANAILTGTIKDSAGNPLSEARINADGYIVTTSPSGYYSMNLPAGNYAAIASKNGYESEFMQVTITEGQTTMANFQLPPLSSSNAILWDTNKKYTETGSFGSALADKSNWTHIPYGLINYGWAGDAMIENEHYYLFLSSNTLEGPSIVAKIGGGENAYSEIYNVYDNGSRSFGTGTLWINVSKNTPEEIILDHAAVGGGGTDPAIPVIIAFNITKKPWLEAKPVQNVNQQGIHSNSRLGSFVFTDINKDVLLDGKKHGAFSENVYPQQGSIGEINFKRAYRAGTDADFMWFLTFPAETETNPLTYQEILYPDTYREWDCKSCTPATGINYAYLGGKVVIGVLNNKDNWKRENVNQYLDAGQTYSTSFIAPYSGKWRMFGVYSDDDWYVTDYFSEVEVNAGNRFTFTSPRGGILEYMVMYLFNRTTNTPANVTTPMDVYRESILHQTITLSCTVKGDKPPCNGIVEDFELLEYINNWSKNIVPDFDLLEAIKTWATI